MQTGRWGENAHLLVCVYFGVGNNHIIIANYSFETPYFQKFFLPLYKCSLIIDIA